MTPIPEKRIVMPLVNKLYELAELTVAQRQGINDKADEIAIEFIRQLREEDMKKIKARLKYCQEQNGLPYCKNCGLCEEDFN